MEKKNRFFQNSRLEYPFNNSKFVQVRQFRANFQKIQNPIKFQIGHQFVWKLLWLKGSDCLTGVPNFNSISWAVCDLYWFEKFKVKRARRHTHTHTSGRQLKITFLDVLDYSDYSVTNISKFCFSRKHSFICEETKLKNSN